MPSPTLHIHLHLLQNYLSIASYGMRQAHVDLMNHVDTITFEIQIMHKLQKKETFRERMMITSINQMIVHTLTLILSQNLTDQLKIVISRTKK